MNATASASLELRSALQAHGDQLDTELRLLRELPQVYLTEKCVFDRGNGRIAKKRVAICSLRCCGEQLDQKSKCNDFSGERACPTVVDAVRFLRAKVENCHGVIGRSRFDFFCDRFSKIHLILNVITHSTHSASAALALSSVWAGGAYTGT